MPATAHIEVRTQTTKGNGWAQSPDVYVTVQIVPENVAPLTVLNHKVAAKRGIQLIHCGEGYSNRCKTTRSMFGAALAYAEEVAAKVNY